MKHFRHVVHAINVLFRWNKIVKQGQKEINKLINIKNEKKRSILHIKMQNML